MRIIISGTCAPALNSNYGLIEAIAVGFRELDYPEIKLVTISQLLEAIDEFKPDATLLVGGLALETIPLSLVHHLCKQARSKLVLWSLEDPYEFDWVLQKGGYFDLICTTDFSSSCFYPGEWNIQHLPLAAPNEPPPQQGKLIHSIRWMFCGVPFKNRINWVEVIRNVHPTGLLIGPDWPNFGQPTRVTNRRISREMLLTLYRVMPITLSIGRRHDLANSSRIVASTPGPRLFEAAGCGAPQLVCESGLEVANYYEPCSEFLWARNAEDVSECFESISKDRYSLYQIGERAWKRTQADHLYSHRAKQIIKWIGDL